MSKISETERAKLRERARKYADSLTPEEDARLHAAALADPDSPPVDDILKRRGRPPLEAPKEAVKLRLDPDVLAHFRATGAGWQTRINDTLRKAVGLKG